MSSLLKPFPDHAAFHVTPVEALVVVWALGRAGEILIDIQNDVQRDKNRKDQTPEHRPEYHHGLVAHSYPSFSIWSALVRVCSETTLALRVENRPNVIDSNPSRSTLMVSL